MTRLRALTCSVLGAALLVGCALGPRAPHHAPMLEAPALGLSGTDLTPIDATWWRSYGDPALEDLVGRALHDNPTLADALARLQMADAVVTATGGALRPRVDAGLTEARTHLSARSFYPPPYAGGTYWNGEADIAVSWHLDFWGRQHDRLAAAQHDARARAISVRGARLAIESAVVSEYLELARAYALSDLATEGAQARSQLVAIAMQRTHAGLDNSLELRAVRAAADDARVDEREAAMRVELAIHRLAALTGQGPAGYVAIARPRLPPGAGPTLPATIPADVLLRRGDIGVALERVRALGALEHAARAASYPDIDLRALAGLSAFGLRDLLSAPARTMSAGISASLPIYDGNRLRAELSAANAAVDGAIADYNAAVLRAVREVADQLTAIDASTSEAADARQRIESLEAAGRLATARRDAGLQNDAPVLEARLHVLAAKRTLVSLDAAGQLARVALIAALGGSPEDPPPTVPTNSQGAP